MATLHYQEKSHTCLNGETVLESLTRQGEAIPSSCCSGICQTCLMRAVKGTPPAAAQNGLKETLRAQNYFLACLCKPETDLEVALPGDDAVCKTTATLLTKEALNRDILRLRLQCEEPLPYRAGQFLNLYRHDGLVRSYSIANVPQDDGVVELHVRLLPNGAMSEWLHGSCQIGDSLRLAGPSGNCFYTPGRPEQSLLLIGTGSGLAPLWGIVQDALAQGHTGPIHLYHGSWTPDGLYLVPELQRLAEQFPNFVYTPCVDTQPQPGYTQGRVDQVALAQHPSLKDWRVFLCGHPDLVAAAKKRAFLAGAAIRDIYADPFVLSKSAA